MISEDVKRLSDSERIERIADHYKSIIELLGEDPSREGLLKTPMRAAKAMWYITSGYRSEANTTLSQAMFEHEGSKVVMVRDIEFYSMCEHHILPFFGHISIAYVPGGKIVGLSKLARTVDICARKLQVQERLTGEVAKVVADTLGAKGVLVICEAEHLCMKMRGVEKQLSLTETIEYTGIFEEDGELRRDTIQALKR
ncbi:MAG: GTP cyclohydrolase I FolE [Muribaculaceae bacterium]|nr:GTP cyclohydrolase I FolE [Muribaculaceae bacterium]